ncbi:MAG: glycyl radical protein [Bacteroidales bacterium]|jgi:pyruvate formate-lyase/glycerol dehydratase family glycyl radical enzyme|nr:glycyl radical protein [Bacteroidales bacterium]MDD2263775.1 glycyl radical protein [Bacteroidales bacterium]MDD2831007.1 glycyl radical protein [Bacteroidales bacterium]MDD3208185.1 glycyl radical protein [Bacteroidales bacterium]MDD3696773.1 glycyl radical protein [Bacteroidales bacterium]
MKPGDSISQRIAILRELSFQTVPSLSIERARIVTDFYRKNGNRYSIPVTRALCFRELCLKQTIYIGEGELIVGERGPRPKAVPTYPELTCHSVEDLHILNSRERQRYIVSDEDIRVYEREIIPFWQGKTQRDRIFSVLPDDWKLLYNSGLFTEFAEQRAPGHTALDGKIYHCGMTGFRDLIAKVQEKNAFRKGPLDLKKKEMLQAMDIACESLIIFAGRHAALALELAAQCRKQGDQTRARELECIAATCRHVPAQAPRNYREALQMYWFVHLGTIIELNGWDAMNPGHLDQHLEPFYQKELESGTLTEQEARELMACLFIKVNNHPAPPKVGVTARESGTYNDFTNINIGGIRSNGSNAVNPVSYIMLDTLEELHLLQPGVSVHIDKSTPEHFLLESCRVISKGYGYPSVFNPGVYVGELIRQGKTLVDAREGGCSGCIEVGAFGKEAYLLTGYLNIAKILEITLNNGTDPVSGNMVSLKTGDVAGFRSFNELYGAFLKQLEYVINTKIRVNHQIERLCAEWMPAPFLSVLIDDCIEKGMDYYNGGPRYNTSYIQCTGLGTTADCLSALKRHVFDDKKWPMECLLNALSCNFEGYEPMRQYILNRTPFFGNDDDFADQLAVRLYEDLFSLIDGRPNTRGGKFHMDMLSTTCHVYFGAVTGALPNGRKAGRPLSDGTSPSHGADTNGPTAVVRSLGKLDQVKSGGTLLNQRFSPSMMKTEEDRKKLASLIRCYFELGGHHIQFNVVDTATLRQAQKEPEMYRDLLVRVAGYSDYFNHLAPALQEDIICRTVNEGF